MAPVDHVSIGSGINAPDAAALLSMKGHRVTVFEREDTHGGCLKTKEAARCRSGRGRSQIYYALNAAPDWNAGGSKVVARIHLAGGIDTVSKSANEAGCGLLPQTPSICVGQPTRLDQWRCPEDKEILWLQIPDALGTLKSGAVGEIDTSGNLVGATREASADGIETVPRKHIRNFDEIGLARVAHSPRNLETMNVNSSMVIPMAGIAPSTISLSGDPSPRHATRQRRSRGSVISEPRHTPDRGWAVAPATTSLNRSASETPLR